MKAEKIYYETNAEEATVMGWRCKTCKRFHGDYKNGAQYCCATVKLCDCGNEIDSKYRTCCDTCRARVETEKWQKAYEKAVEWDGVAPLYSESWDKYFFFAEEIADYLHDIAEEDTAEGYEDGRFRLCEPNNGRHFEMNEFLYDDLGEDQELDTAEIDKIVNDWIAARSPISWSPSGKPVTLESIEKHLNYKDLVK